MVLHEFTAVRTNRHELHVLAATHRLEYRVRPTSGHPAVWKVVPVTTLLTVFFYAIFEAKRFAFLVTSLVLVYWWSSNVLWESVVVYPPNGLQLETCRGFTFLPILSRKFIPNIFVKDVLINEGLHRWSVRYYLALLVNPGDRYELVVAFKETLPHFPILLEVYEGLIECLRLGSVPHGIYRRGGCGT